MDKIQFRAVTKHFWMAAKTGTDIRNILLEVYGGYTSTFLTISFRVGDSKHGRTQWTPKKPLQTIKCLTLIHDAGLANRRLKLKVILETTGFLEERVSLILRKTLNMKAFLV